VLHRVQARKATVKASEADWEVWACQAGLAVTVPDSVAVTVPDSVAVTVADTVAVTARCPAAGGAATAAATATDWA